MLMHSQSLASRPYSTPQLQSKAMVMREPPSTRETLPRVLPGTLTSGLSALRAQKRSRCFCEGRHVPLGLWGGAVVPSAEVLWAVMRSHLCL